MYILLKLLLIQFVDIYMVHLCGGVWLQMIIIIRTIVAISIEIQLDKSPGRRRSEKEKQKIGIVESLIGA